jgi:L-rhamnose isomerase
VAAQSEKPGAIGLVLEQKREFLKTIREAPEALEAFKIGCENKFWELQHTHQHHQWLVRIASILHPVGYKHAWHAKGGDFPRQSDMVEAEAKIKAALVAMAPPTPIDWLLGQRRHRLTTQNMAKYAFLKAHMQILLDQLFGEGAFVLPEMCDRPRSAQGRARLARAEPCSLGELQIPCIGLR